MLGLSEPDLHSVSNYCVCQTNPYPWPPNTILPIGQQGASSRVLVMRHPLTEYIPTLCQVHTKLVFPNAGSCSFAIGGEPQIWEHCSTWYLRGTRTLLLLYKCNLCNSLIYRTPAGKLGPVKHSIDWGGLYLHFRVQATSYRPTYSSLSKGSCRSQAYRFPQEQFCLRECI